MMFSHNNSDSSVDADTKEKLKEYCIGKCISDAGSFGFIHIAKQRSTGAYYVLKIMSKRQIKEEDMVEQMLLEITLQSELDHPNVLKVRDYFEDDRSIYIVMDYMMKGDMCDMLDEYDMLDEEEARTYVRDIARGLKYLHDNHVVHRDIKLENMLVDDSNTIKIADFGLAAKTNVVLTEQEIKRRKRRGMEEDEMTVVCGTTDYMAPEMLKELKYNEKIDVWALGIIMHELLVGDVPYDSEKFKKFTRKGKKTNRKKDKRQEKQYIKHMLAAKFSFPDYLSADAKDLLAKMLEKDPAKRWSAAQVLQHPWLAEPETVTEPDMKRQRTERTDASSVSGVGDTLGDTLGDHGCPGC